MKKEFIQTSKILLTAVVLSLGVSYVYAWTAPTDAPPAGNTPEPINVGSVAQDKDGVLRAWGLRSFLDLTVDGDMDVLGGITLGGVRETAWPAETDPTVTASVKDGVSWSEVSARPTGIAQGACRWVASPWSCTWEIACNSGEYVAGLKDTGGDCPLEIKCCQAVLQ